MNNKNITATINRKVINKLKIISINVNSIVKNQRRASLMNLINTQKPDIILINETKLNKNHVISFEKYNIIRNDRKEKNMGGGTAIVIKKNIKYTEIILPDIQGEKLIEHTIIKIDTINDNKLYIIAVYARCGYKKEFIPNLNKIFLTLKLNLMENYYIIAGDLNAKHFMWKNLNNNLRGIQLMNWMERNSIIYKTKLLSTKLPSYPRGNSFLDIVLTDTRLTFHNADDDRYLDNIPYDSDHNAVYFQVSLEKNDRLELENDLKYKYNYKETNWEKFNKVLEKQVTVEVPNTRNLKKDEIENYIQQFNEWILKAMEKSVPKIKDKNSVNVYINHKIRRLQKKKK